VAHFHELNRYLTELVYGIGQFYLQDVAAVKEPLVMLSEAKEICLLPPAVPVAPDALKDGAAVVQGVGHNPYLGFG